MRKLSKLTALTMMAAVALAWTPAAMAAGRGRKGKGQSHITGVVVSVKPDCVKVKTRIGEEEFAVTNSTKFEADRKPGSIANCQMGRRASVDFTEDDGKKIAAKICTFTFPASWREELADLQEDKSTLQRLGGHAEEMRKLNLRLIELCNKIKRDSPWKDPGRSPDYASILVTLAEAYLETGDLALARLNANTALPIVEKSASLHRSGALGFRGLTAEQSLERAVTKRKDQMLPKMIEVFKKLVEKAPGDVALAKNLKAAEEIMQK